MKYWLFLLVVLVVSAALITCLVVFIEKNYWIIPAVFLFTFLVLWCLFKEVFLRLVLFPFSNKFVMYQITLSLNMQYNEELKLLMDSCAIYIEQYMAVKEYTSIPYKLYREGDKKFLRLIEFLEKFVPANEILIRDHKQKLENGKKTRRIKISPQFERITKIMRDMLNIFTEVAIRPVASGERYKFKNYYQDLSSFDRMTYDRNTLQQTNGVNSFDRFLPIAFTESDRKELMKFADLATEFTQISERCAYPFRVPVFLRCCCRGRSRTGCKLFYTPLFGLVK